LSETSPQQGDGSSNLPETTLQVFDALGENAHDKQKYRQSTGPIFKNKRGFMKKQRCCALATMSMIVSLPATAFLALAAFASAQTALVYQKSPEPIERLLDAPRTPFVKVWF
jgi:hypothetical protein